MTIMTSYFQISDDVINLFKFYNIFTHRMFLPSLSIIWLESEKNWKNIASLIMFLAKHSLINWLPWEQ